MAVLVTRFKRWLDLADPGDQYCYHYGHLAKDRFDDDGGEVPNELDVLAKTVYSLYEEGKVSLYQVPLDGIRGHEYIARKSPKGRFDARNAFQERMKDTPWTQASIH